MVAGQGELSASAFLDRVAGCLRHDLVPEGPPARIRRRGTLLQVDFGQPSIHYEVWLQQQRRQVEVGLHFEADRALNSWLLDRFGPEMLAVRGELGPEVELEQWTESWGRIHTYLPITAIDDALAERTAERLLSTIVCLQPRLSAFLAAWQQ